MSKRVVVTGMGTINPIGCNVDETWKNAVNGLNGIKKIDNETINDFGVHVAGLVSNYDGLEYFNKKQLRTYDKVVQFAIVAAREAYSQAKLDEVEDRFRISTCVSSGIGGLDTIQKELTTAVTKGYKKVSPYFIPNSIVNLVSGNVAIDLNLKGGCTTVVTACASGTDSIGSAYNNIISGFNDIVVCGASEASVNEIGMTGFNNIKALNRSSDVNNASIPFDTNRSGFVMGEGAAVIVIESYESAISRGVEILGEIVGYNTTCDASHITAPDSEAVGAVRAFETMISRSSIDKNDINYINCHGTSTILNEKTEAVMINKVFKNNKMPTVTSSKSMTGHLLGAAGALEAIITLKTIKDQIITPTINIKEVDPSLNLNVCLESTKQKINIGVSTSLGFGGHNSMLAFKGMINE